MPVVKRLTLTYGGTSEQTAEDALMEAMRRLKDGNVESADQTDGGGYYFSVSEDVPEKEWPRGVNAVRSYRADALVIRCPRFFANPAFVAWLNKKEWVATWHTGGVPTDWSDAFVLVDPGLGGEGSEQDSVDFPQDIWDEIVAECRAAFKPSHRHHIVVWLQNVPPSRILIESAAMKRGIGSTPTGEVVLDCAAFFGDSAFLTWLNSDERKATWHRGGEPTESADTFLMVPAALYGESCVPPDELFPEHIWEAILSECRRQYRPDAHADYIVVWLRNQQ